MKRHELKAALVVVLVALSGGAQSSPATARDSQESRVLLSMLDEHLEMKDFTAPMTFKEAVELLAAKFAGKGKDLRIFVDAEAFTRSDGTNVYQSQVQFQPYPKKMAAWVCLEIMLSQVESGNAAYTIRRGAIIVTTKEMASFDHLRKEKVHGAFTKQPLAEALDDLADQIGVDITVDKRCIEKANSRVSALFRNSTLEDAVLLLADQADLKAVALPSGFYVTSKENAKRMQQELDRQQKEASKKK